jgi:hypothetical protein
MTNVKLTPDVDLGLGSMQNSNSSTDTSSNYYPSNNQSISMDSQLPTDLNITNQSPLGTAASEPSLDGISSVSSFVNSSQPLDAVTPVSTSIEMPQAPAAFPGENTPLTIAPSANTDTISVQTTAKPTGMFSTAFLIIAAVLFIGALGALIYFALMYFNVI